MAKVFSQPEQFGLFVPTTQVWDVAQLAETDVQSDEFKELLVRMYQNLNIMSIVLNLKDSGYYPVTEFVNGQLYFPNPDGTSFNADLQNYRQVYRLVVNFGALPNTGLKSVPHRIPINEAYSFTRIYATASDPVNLVYKPIPYASLVLTDVIELSVSANDVRIITAADYSAFTICYVVLEYIKN